MKLRYFGKQGVRRGLIHSFDNEAKKALKRSAHAMAGLRRETSRAPNQFACETYCARIVISIDSEECRLQFFNYISICGLAESKLKEFFNCLRGREWSVFCYFAVEVKDDSPCYWAFILGKVQQPARCGVDIDASTPDYQT